MLLKIDPFTECGTYYLSSKTICLTNGLTSATATIVEVGYRVDNFSDFLFVTKKKLFKKIFLEIPANCTSKIVQNRSNM